MRHARRAARAAQRRLVARGLVARGGAWVAVGATIGLTLVVAGRWMAPHVHWGWLLAGPVVAAGLAGGIGAWLAAPSLLDAARALDRALDLDDRLSSGLALGASPTTDGMVALTIEEADRLAVEINPRRAVPIVWPWGWWAALGAVALAVGAGTWLPARTTPGRRPAVRADAARARERVADVIAAGARPDAALEAVPEGTEDSALRARLEELDEIGRQLRETGADPRRAAAQAATVLSEMAGEREERARAAQRAEEAWRAGLARGSDDRAPATEGLGDAVRRAELDRAQELARRLAEQRGAMSPAERAAAARELEELARDLRGLGEPAPGEAAPGDSAPGESISEPAPGSGLANDVPGAQDRGDAERAGASPTADGRPSAAGEQGGSASPTRTDDAAAPAPPGAESLRRAGMEPEAARALAPRPPEEIASELEKRGLDPADAARLAEEVAHEQEVDRARQEAARRATELAEAAERAAESLREPEARGGGAGSNDQPARADRETAPRDRDQRATPEPVPEGGQPAEAGRTGAGAPARADAPPPSTERKEERRGRGDSASPSGEADRQNKPGEARRGPARPAPRGSTGADGERVEGAGSAPGAPSGKAGAGSEPQTGGAGAPGDREGPGKDAARASDRPASGAGLQGESGTERGTGARQESRPRTDRPMPGRPGSEDAPPGRESGDARSHGTPDPGRAPGSGPEPGAAPRGQQSRDGVKDLADTLERMARERRAAEQAADQAQGLRDRARRVVEAAAGTGSDPSDAPAPDGAGADSGLGRDPRPGAPGGGARRAERVPAPLARADAPGPLPAETVPVDARARGAAERPLTGDERPVGEWLGPGPGAGADGAARRRQVQEAVAEAARSAERAVEDRTIHRRYDRLLRGYFRRLPARVLGEGAPAPGAAPAPDAP